MIAANFKTPVPLAWRSLLARLSLERGRRVTGQAGLAEAIVDFFVKHGEKVPPELIKAAEPGGAEMPAEAARPRARGKQAHLKPVIPSDR